ncbi:MAG TPA: polysaccharide biosynthesis/export family protein [Nitrospiria bacterium]
MTLVRVILFFLLLAPFFPPGIAQSQDYILGPRDLLRITVYDHKDLETKVRVSEDGKITFPLLGEVRAAGLTVQGLEREITKMLADGYIVNPNVGVFVEEFRVVVYVTGEVRKPGSFPYEAGMTVLKAIALAGGLTDKAAPGRTQIIRKTNDKEDTLRAKMEDPIEPEDVVVVPESFF